MAKEMIIADLHIHSRYSRATSRQMDIEHLAETARMKGINLLGTGDFTHFQWLSELKTYLKPVSYGIYEYKGTHFVLTTEISCIYSKGGRTRRIHNLVVAPDFATVDKINQALSRIGNLDADGRPILGLDAKELVKIVLNISEDCLFIPAHIWTPWFSLFGANSGFDSIEECFGEWTKYISALETGLSSDPAMNWRISSLDRFTLVSNSDAHSPDNLGREANVFNCPLDYHEICQAMTNHDKDKFLYTIEFFPEEGKYHWDGHRNCGLKLSPAQTRAYKGICPKCGKPITRGVLYRVEELADRKEGFNLAGAIPYRSLVPLAEIIAAALGKVKTSKIVSETYRQFISQFGNEFKILLDTDPSAIARLEPRVAEGIRSIRNGNLEILPGYDGVYGKLNLFPRLSVGATEQLNLF